MLVARHVQVLLERIWLGYARQRLEVKAFSVKAKSRTTKASWALLPGDAVKTLDYRSDL